MQKTIATVSMVTMLGLALPVAALTVSDVTAGVGLSGSTANSVNVSSEGADVNTSTQVNVGVNASTTSSQGASGSGTSVGSTGSASASGTSNGSVSIFPISIQRSDINASSDTNSSAVVQANIPNPATVTADSELGAYITSEMNGDADLQKVQATDDALSITYRMPAKLLGFIPVSVNATALVDSDGGVTVSYPWYSFLLSTTDKSALESTIQSRVDADLGTGSSAQSGAASTTASVSANAQAQGTAAAHFTSQVRARIISDIRAVLDAAASSSVSSSTQVSGTASVQ